GPPGTPSHGQAAHGSGVDVSLLRGRVLHDRGPPGGRPPHRLGQEPPHRAGGPGPSLRPPPLAQDPPGLVAGGRNRQAGLRASRRSPPPPQQTPARRSRERRRTRPTTGRRRDGRRRAAGRLGRGRLSPGFTPTAVARARTRGPRRVGSHLENRIVEPRPPDLNRLPTTGGQGPAPAGPAGPRR